jgi:type VI protein secretion system component VasF
MQTASILNIGHAIQLAVAPVFLLAGVGALLAVLTNRLARIIDRVHFIERQLETVVSAEQREENARATVSLARRARFIHWAISLCTTCDLLVCVVVAMIFISHELGVDLSTVIAGLFIAAMLSLIAGLLCFLREISLATALIESLDNSAADR